MTESRRISAEGRAVADAALEFLKGHTVPVRATRLRAPLAERFKVAEPFVGSAISESYLNAENGWEYVHDMDPTGPTYLLLWDPTRPKRTFTPKTEERWRTQRVGVAVRSVLRERRGVWFTAEELVPIIGYPNSPAALRTGINAAMATPGLMRGCEAGWWNDEGRRRKVWRFKPAKGVPVEGEMEGQLQLEAETVEEAAEVPEPEGDEGYVLYATTVDGEQLYRGPDGHLYRAVWEQVF